MWRLSRHSMPIRWPSRWAWCGEIRAVVGFEERDDPLLHLGARCFEAVVVGDLEAPGQDVAQQAEIGVVHDCRRDHPAGAKLPDGVSR